MIAKNVIICICWKEEIIINSKEKKYCLKCNKEIAKDNKRLNILSNLGYQTYVIWQCDYKNNLESTVNELFSLIENNLMLKNEKKE